MAEAAARLKDHVFPRLPVRQWVLSVPSPSLSLGTTLPNEINNLGDYSGVYGTTVA
jgi:hypothetical protein